MNNAGWIVSVLLVISLAFALGCRGSDEFGEPGDTWISPSTGMEFVWIEALDIWVGKYEVMNAQYRMKEPAHDSSSVDGYTLNSARQPVVYVNFDDARAFAEWLSGQDSGELAEGYRYRLPSEHEWMIYAQCGDGREFPWGNDWPPVSGQAGNYADETFEAAFGGSGIAGYNDGHAVSAPVDELWVNHWGLVGVGGNVQEVCASDSTGESFGAWRDADWSVSSQDNLRCSWRIGIDDNYRGIDAGFRLVLSR